MEHLSDTAQIFTPLTLISPLLTFWSKLIYRSVIDHTSALFCHLNAYITRIVDSIIAVFFDAEVQFNDVEQSKKGDLAGHYNNVELMCWTEPRFIAFEIYFHSLDTRLKILVGWILTSYKMGLHCYVVVSNQHKILNKVNYSPCAVIPNLFYRIWVYYPSSDNVSFEKIRFISTQIQIELTKRSTVEKI